MTPHAPRPVDQYLTHCGRNSREMMAPSHPDKSESDVLELIASPYGAPDARGTL